MTGYSRILWGPNPVEVSVQCEKPNKKKKPTNPGKWENRIGGGSRTIIRFIFCLRPTVLILPTRARIRAVEIKYTTYTPSPNLSFRIIRNITFGRRLSSSR